MSDPKMSKPVSGATDEPRPGDEHDEVHHEPDPAASWSEFIGDGVHSEEPEEPPHGGPMGGGRGLAARKAQPPVRAAPDRPRPEVPAGSRPEDADARARQHAGLRRYRGTAEGSPRAFRAEPGPLARSGEPRTERSDASIEQDVRKFLEHDGMVDAGGIEVYVDHGEVSLRGHVTSERTRYRAGELTTHIAGVTVVHNELEVVDPD